MTDKLYFEIDDTFDETKVSVDTLPEETEQECKAREERIKEIIKQCQK